MSETNSYKNVTLSGLQAFAVARALRGRLAMLGQMIAEVQAAEVLSDAAFTFQYLNDQRRHTEAALEAINGAALFVPMSEGLKP